MLSPGVVVPWQMPTLVAGPYGPWVSTCELGCMDQSRGMGTRCVLPKELGGACGLQEVACRVGLRLEAQGSVSGVLGEKPMFLGSKSLLGDIQSNLGSRVSLLEQFGSGSICSQEEMSRLWNKTSVLT